jgi:hypothetical protein
MLAWTLLALILLGLSFTTKAEQANIVSGVVSAADHEVEEGYFALGSDITVVAKPGSALHQWLSANRNQRVTITVERDVTE